LEKKKPNNIYCFEHFHFVFFCRRVGTWEREIQIHLWRSWPNVLWTRWLRLKVITTIKITTMIIMILIRNLWPWFIYYLLCFAIYFICMLICIQPIYLMIFTKLLINFLKNRFQKIASSFYFCLCKYYKCLANIVICNKKNDLVFMSESREWCYIYIIITNTRTLECILFLFYFTALLLLCIFIFISWVHAWYPLISSFSYNLFHCSYINYYIV